MRVVWLVLAFLLGACLNNPPPKTSPSPTSHPAAKLECVDGPSGPIFDFFLRRGHYGQSWTPELEAHENQHLTIALSNNFKACADWVTWLNTGDNRLRGEAAAFCAQAKASVEVTGRYKSLDYAINDVSQGMVTDVYPQWYGVLTRDEAVKLIRTACGLA